MKRLLTDTPLVGGSLHPFNEQNFTQHFYEIKENMVGAILWPIRVPCQAQYLDAVQLALESIDEAQRIISQTSGMKIVYTADEMEQAHSEGKIGVLIGIEGGHLLGSSVAVLRMLYTLGARFISMTSYECSSPWVAAHTTKDQIMIEEEDTPKSLTEFGKVRKLKKRMRAGSACCEKCHKWQNNSTAQIEARGTRD